MDRPLKLGNGSRQLVLRDVMKITDPTILYQEIQDIGGTPLHQRPNLNALETACP